MLKKPFLCGLILTLIFVFASCEKDYLSQGLLKCYVENVTASTAAISITAEVPSDVDGFFVGVLACKRDPKSNITSEECFGDIVAAQPGMANYKIALYGLEPGTKYNVRAYVRTGLEESIKWGDMISFTTLTILPGEAVDLGLSVKWANMNVGATKPEEFGDYFAWGETKPKAFYSWDTYMWGECNNYTKYCSDSQFGVTDYKTILEKDDDAATSNWGDQWRIPSYGEWEELKDPSNCEWTWMTLDGITGYKVQSKRPGFTDNWIFLPAAGSYTDDILYFDGDEGVYWSLCLLSYPRSVQATLFYKGHDDVEDLVGVNTRDRSDGLSVRPVLRAPGPVLVPSLLGMEIYDISDLSVVIRFGWTGNDTELTEMGVLLAKSESELESSTKHVVSYSGQFHTGDLEPSTKYYVKSYATNAKGTAYSEVMSFSTLAPASAPIFKSIEVRDIEDTSANIIVEWEETSPPIYEKWVYIAKSMSDLLSPSAIQLEGDCLAVTDLEPSTEYYVMAYATNDRFTTYSDVISFTTLEKHDYVDLGLSVKWATCNIGAASPELFGDYFAWGETEPKPYYDWNNNKFYYTDIIPYSKYWPTIDDKNVLDPEDDAASVNWSCGWRMPTIEEWEELANESNCSWTWTDIDELYGYKVQSKKPGFTDNWIFLPAAGMLGNPEGIDYGNAYGFYWSSSLDIDYWGPTSARKIKFTEDEVDLGWGLARYLGLTIRPVRE